jgi:hypothetical protein
MWRQHKKSGGVKSMYESLQELFLTCIHGIITVAVPVFSGMAVAFFKSKTEQIKSQIKSERARCYLDELTGAVSAAVARTNNIYVDELKKSDGFSAPAQASALTQTKEAAVAALTSDAKKFFEDNHANLQKLLEAKIEEAVRAQKR